MNADIPVIYILSTNAGVGALVGGTGMGTARVFPGELPQGQNYPAIVVDQFDTEPFDTKSGVSAVDNETIKVFCYAETAVGAADLSQAVRTAIDGNSGTFNGYTLQHIRYLRNDSSSINLTNRKLFLREMDFLVRIKN